MFPDLPLPLALAVFLPVLPPRNLSMLSSNQLATMLHDHLSSEPVSFLILRIVPSGLDDMLVLG